MKKTSLFALVALTLFTFISCENFLKGEDVKEEITKTIEYNNAPSYPINVELLNDSDGKIKTPATGEVSKKVTDEFTIRFEPAADHVFVKWEAIVKDLSKGEVPSDYIQFDDAESTETTVTFKKASNKVIIIRPVCPPRLSYTMYQTESGVLPRDSSVELTFNQEVATDLSSSAADYISITGDTIDVDEHFKSPEVKGKKLIFKADTTTDGYIPIENNNQRGITVRIPKEKIWYINKDYTEPVKVYLDADIKETYFINSETSSKTVFKYKLLQDKNEKDLGILKIDEKENDNEKQYAYSVGQQFALKYRIPEGYSFQKWNFYNNKNELLDPDLLSLEFSEEEYTNDLVQVKITVTNYIPDTLTITPIIHETLKVTSFNLGDSYKTYERDSDIVLGFNKDLAPECIDNIIIQIPGLPEGKTVDDYFEPAVINGKTYTRKAKKIAAAKLIPLGLDGTNTITISMAASDVYYVETLSDGTTANVGFDADTVLSYKINAETINKIKIKFFVEDDYSTTGEYKIDGIVASGLVQDLTPGKSVKLRFKLTSDDYYFKGWRVTRSYNEAGVAKEDSYEQGSFYNDNLAEIGLSVAYDDNENEFGYEALTKIAQAIITVDEYKEGTFAISPVIVPIPTANVIIDGSNGKFSPAKGTYRIKEKIFENLSFDPDGDYEFIRWQIYNETTGEEYNNADYITINDLKAERTSYAVVRVPEEKDSEGNDIKLAIRPVVTERPQILSYSPMYSAAGALRDTTIQVLFDYDMSVYSIYYTENELDSLRHTLMIDDDKDESETVTGNKLLSVMRNGVKNYYGYKTNGTTYLKNLSIKNNRTGENLNGCYKEPVFETARSLSLRVSDIVPPAYTQISISIERGFFYEMEGKTISMSGAKKWIYQVGSSEDTSGPAVEEATIKYYTGKDDQDEDKYETLVALRTETQVVGENQTNKVVVYDTDPNYTKPSINQTTFSGIEDLIYIAEKTYPDEDGDGEEEKKVELSVDFTVNDNNATSSAFNVFYNKIYDSNYDWVEGDEPVRSFGVYYDSTMGSIGQYQNNIDLSFLDDGIYAIWFTFPDAARWTTIYPALSDDQNPAVDYIPKNKFYVAIDRTAPQVVSTEISDINAPKRLKLFWDYELGYCPDIKEISMKFHGDDAQVYTPFDSPDYSLVLNGPTVKTDKNYSKNGLIGGKHYSVDITFKDWAGNSVTCNLDETTIPSAPTSVTMPEGHGTDIRIEYTMPDTDFSGTRIRYREKGTTKWLPEVAETDKDGNLTGAYVEAPIENTTKETSLEAYIENLDYAKQYEFEIYSYDLASGKESPVYRIDNALPEHITKPASARITGSKFKDYTNQGLIYYYTPDSAYDGLKVIYSTSSNFSNATTYEIPNSSSSSLGKNVIRSFTLSSSTSGALTPGTEYYFKIVAWYANKNNNVVVSNYWSSYTKTAPVTNLSLSSRTSNSLTVQWTKPAGNCSKYIIQYKLASASNWESNEVAATSNTTNYYTISSYNNAVLVGGNAYNVKVTAQSYNNSDTVENATAGWKTYPNAVTNVSAQKQSSTSIKVSWTNPTGSYDEIGILKAESEAGLNNVAAIKPGNNATNYTFTGLAQGKEYFFKIVTYAYNNPSNPSSGFVYTSSSVYQCSTDIDPVSNPSATADSATQITLSWTNPDSASYDGVQVSSNNGSSWTSVSGKTTTSYSYTSLSPNTSYTFKIRTYKAVGSETKYAAVDAGTVCTLASPVTGLSSPAHTSTYVKLKWTNPASASYEKIEIYAGTSKAGEITNKTTNEFTVENLTSGTRPTFYVKTINKDGVASSTYGTYYVSLDTAKNLTVSSTGTTYATVTWTVPTGSYSNLYVYYKKSSASTWSNSGALSSSTTSYTIGSSTDSTNYLDVGTKYDVKVVTYKSAWTDQETSSVSFYTKPNAPTNLKVSSRTTTSITYSWTAPTGNFGRYDLMWKKVGSSVNATYISTDKTSYTINNLSAGEQYEAYLRVCPVDDTTTMNLNAAATTSTIKNYTRPNAPTGLSAAYDNGNVKLSWTKPTGSQNYYYVLYRKTGSTGSWSGNFIGGTYNSYTFENLHDYNDYDFKVQSNCYNSSAGEDIYSDDSTIVTKRTPPPAVSSASLYTDDGMGNIQVKYTFPSFTSANMEVDFYINGTYICYTGSGSYVSGGTGYRLLTISNFARGTTYTIGVKTYVYNSTYGWIAGPMKTFTVTNSTGDIKLAGTEYSYTRLKNVITSNTTINKKNTNGSFTANNCITLTPYSIGAYEVTQNLFEAVMGTNPSGSTSANYPVTHVSWYAAIAFCNKLSAMMGLDPCYTVGTISNSAWKDFSYSDIPTVNDDNWNKATCDFTKNGYHLPTEYQWEFAARGGSTTAADWNYTYAGSNTSSSVGNSSNSLKAVGTLQANRLGLYDMTGNVWEITNDWGSSTPPAVTATDFTVNYNSSYRTNSYIVYKGSAYFSSSLYGLSYRLMCQASTFKNGDLGFRICRNKTY